MYFVVVVINSFPCLFCFDSSAILFMLLFHIFTLLWHKKHYKNHSVQNRSIKCATIQFKTEVSNMPPFNSEQKHQIWHQISVHVWAKHCESTWLVEVTCPAFNWPISRHILFCLKFGHLPSEVKFHILCCLDCLLQLWFWAVWILLTIFLKVLVSPATCTLIKDHPLGAF